MSSLQARTLTTRSAGAAVDHAARLELLEFYLAHHEDISRCAQASLEWFRQGPASAKDYVGLETVVRTLPAIKEKNLALHAYHDRMNGFPKVVVSTTLDRAKWQNSTLISGNVAEEISQLKQRPGRNINMSGSGTLVSWLLREGLLDQLDLLQFPVVVGRGKRLFEGEGGQAGLTLAGSQTFSSGVVHLSYQRAGG